jgi:hypothetical protein
LLLSREWERYAAWLDITYPAFWSIRRHSRTTTTKSLQSIQGGLAWSGPLPSYLEDLPREILGTQQSQVCLQFILNQPCSNYYHAIGFVFFAVEDEHIRIKEARSVLLLICWAS